MKDLFESLSENVSEECFEDICKLVEEFINEVSTEMWKRAAENSLKGREPSQPSSIAKGRFQKFKDYLDKERKRTPGGQSIDAYVTPTKNGSKRRKVNYPRDIDWKKIEKEDKIENKLESRATVDPKAEKRYQHAKDVISALKRSSKNVGANKLIDSSARSYYERGRNSEESAGDVTKSKEATKRQARSSQILGADPVKGHRKSFKEEHFKNVVLGDNYVGDMARKEAKEKMKRALSNSSSSRQAKTDHEDAQINQALRNKLENIYKNSKGERK